MKLHQPTFLATDGNHMNGWTLHAEANPTADTTVDFTGIGIYDRLFVLWEGLGCDTDLRGAGVRFSFDGGAFLAGAADYQYAGNGHTTGSVNVSDASSAQVNLQEAANAAFMGTGGGETCSGYLWVFKTKTTNADAQRAAGYYSALGVGTGTASHAALCNFGVIVTPFESSLDGLQFIIIGTGDYNAGRIRVYGIHL